MQGGWHIRTHDEFLACHPIPDQHPMQRHPEVHSDDVLHDLYHAPVHGAERTSAQHGYLRRRVGRNGTGAEFPKMDTDIRACSSGARIGGRASGRAVLEEDDKVLCGVECKVLDAHAKVVDDEPCLVYGVAREPRGDEPACRAILLECLGKQPTYELVCVTMPR